MEKEYLVKYYDKDKEGLQKLEIASESGMFNLLDAAKRDQNLLICIYEIGKCVIDWS
jgi:hypothetical protein